MSRLTVQMEDRAASATKNMIQEFQQRIVANPPGACPVDMQLAFL